MVSKHEPIILLPFDAPNRLRSRQLKGVIALPISRPAQGENNFGIRCVSWIMNFERCLTVLIWVRFEAFGAFVCLIIGVRSVTLKWLTFRVIEFYYNPSFPLLCELFAEGL